MRRSTYTPRLPGVARHSRTPVWSRYAVYSSARCVGVTPCQTRAISRALEPVELGDGALIADVSRMEGRIRLEQQHVGLFVGDGEMLDAVRNDDEFTGVDHQLGWRATELHAQPAFHHEEKLVLGLVVMPHELALEFREFHVTIVHCADDFRTPLVLKAGEHFRVPLGPVLSNVAVASDTTYVVKPRLPAIRAVVETHMFVCSPTRTSVVRPRRRRSASSDVPMNALLTDFWTTGSPAIGRTSSLISTPGCPGRSGDCGSPDKCLTWMIGRPDLRHAACSRAMFCSSAGLLRLKRSA